MNAEPFIQLQNVRKVYRTGGTEHVAVSDVTLDIDEGDLTDWRNKERPAFHVQPLPDDEEQG